MSTDIYSVLGPDGWERFDDREEWLARSIEIIEQRDKDPLRVVRESDAMEW